ncbi:unnamed protein product [Arctogadus glacialis]
MPQKVCFERRPVSSSNDTRAQFKVEPRPFLRPARSIQSTLYQRVKTLMKACACRILWDIFAFQLAPKNTFDGYRLLRGNPPHSLEPSPMLPVCIHSDAWGRGGGGGTNTVTGPGEESNSCSPFHFF